jgi:hypothetical protein
MSQFEPTLVIDDVLQVPLYHGTSSLWLDSIRSKGLGGAMPPISDALAFLTHLYEQCRHEAPSYGIEKMLAQASDGANWQHGQVYFSSEQAHAEDYARSNSLGSELLSECENYVRSLQITSLPDWYVALVNQPRKPILITVSALNLADLEPEVQGGSARGSIEEMIRIQTSFVADAHAKFDSIEDARKLLRQGKVDHISPEQWSLLFANKGVDRETLVSRAIELARIGARGTFRLRAGVSIPFDQLSVSEIREATPDD